MKKGKLEVKNLIEFLNKTLKTSYKINKKNNLSDIALNSHHKWDSLTHTKLLSAIETKFKISINEKNIDHFSNLDLIFQYLSKDKNI